MLQSELCRVEFDTVPSNYQILVPTKTWYASVVGIQLPDRYVGCKYSTVGRKASVLAYEMPQPAADGLADFYEEYVAYDDPANRSNPLGPFYLCRTLPLFMRGERPRNAQETVDRSRAFTDTYVPLPSGMAIPAGMAGAVRSKGDDGRGPRVIHEFVSLGAAACVQAVNAYGNFGILEYSAMLHEYASLGPEIIVPPSVLESGTIRV